jgi:hypothetical protein
LFARYQSSFNKKPAQTDFCLEVSQKFSDVANDNGGRIGH